MCHNTSDGHTGLIDIDTAKCRSVHWFYNLLTRETSQINLQIYHLTVFVVARVSTVTRGERLHSGCLSYLFWYEFSFWSAKKKTLLWFRRRIYKQFQLVIVATRIQLEINAKWYFHHTWNSDIFFPRLTQSEVSFHKIERFDCGTTLMELLPIFCFMFEINFNWEIKKIIFALNVSSSPVYKFFNASFSLSWRSIPAINSR